MELEGRLASSEARLKPLTSQVEQLQMENSTLKIERDEQEDLIADLHALVREVQQEREAIVAAADLERNQEQETRGKLEGSLEVMTERHETAHTDYLKSRKRHGMTVMVEVIHRFKTKSLHSAMANFEANFVRGRGEEALADANEEAEVAKAGSGMRMVRERLQAWLKDAAVRSVANWRLNQLDSEGRSIESQRLLLAEKLAVAKALEASRIREYERMKDENLSLSSQLKESQREKQILFMEVENLKTIGEQLVSELVTTASEVSKEFSDFKRDSNRSSFKAPVSLSVNRISLRSTRQVEETAQ